MREAAAQAGVALVTGDTKVVDRGKGDQIFINTSGIGVVPEGVHIHPSRAQLGDKILISGPIAVHGIAIMSVREGLEFETEIASDTAPLNGLVQAMLAACPDIHVLRDPTRGGVDERAGGDRRAGRRSAFTWKKPASPSARRSKAPARSWASTHSTSPTKASCSPSCRADAAERRARRHAQPPVRPGSRAHRRGRWTTIPAWSR